MDPEIERAVLKTEYFYITHLDPGSVSDIQDINSFSIDMDTGAGLLIYIQKHASREELSNEMRTYLIRDTVTNECAGYFSLKAGLISINERKRDRTGDIEDTGKEFDTLPGIELANFAVNSAFIKEHPALKGVGKYFFGRLIIPLIETISKYIGVKMVYIFALPYKKVIKCYKSYGFSSLSEEAERNLHRRIKPSYDKNCKFMYMLIGN